jgi:hypothetical protein
MYLKDILCLTIVVHGYVWYYAYLSMWKPANFQVVFDNYCLYRVGIGMGDPTSVIVCIWKIFCAYQ